LPAEAAMGQGWSRAIHPDDLSAVTEEWKRTCAVGTTFRMEYRYLRPDESVVWTLGQALEERDSTGRLVGYIGTTTDTTELHRMREALQQSHAELEERVRERTLQFEHMALIVAASADAIISSDMEGRIVSWNQAAERIFGYPASETIGQTTFLLTPPSLHEEARLLKAQVRRGERVENLETIRVARSGELIEVALSIFPLRDNAGKIIGTSGIVRDIRAQKKAERRLRELSGRLLRVQDEERRHLARDLHDSTAQSLAALSINLSLLNDASALPEEKRKAMVAAGLALAQSIERELRTHTYLLHPPLLEDHGLVAALRWFADGFTARSGVAVQLEVDEDLGRMPDLFELTIFRVVQECLSNIHRHSKSSTASIRLGNSEGVITLEVRDAGCGFPRELAEGAGVGIAGMRERLAQIGGTLDIQTAPSGVTVTARIPQA
jgi:PAS domain S-box-containing protein